MPSRDLLIFLLAAASKLSGYPEIPVEALPPVHALPLSELRQAICPEDPPSCSTVAANFATERYEILILDSLDLEDASDNSFLVHELVHVLQWKQHGDDIFKGCRNRLKTEGEAYRVQNAYLRREGRFLRFGEMLAYTQCAEDTSTLFPRDAMAAPSDGKPANRDEPVMTGPVK